ncbi:NlpC/P60 family protein [Sciscionella marina]|uniref:C40 family peptidase n=1 Tax=Sciscionella marina TaxID=508770 RepID=UPI00037D291E|nr:NlpC/P60 family protein [Sciscionella marina]
MDSNEPDGGHGAGQGGGRRRPMIIAVVVVVALAVGGILTVSQLLSTDAEPRAAADASAPAGETGKLSASTPPAKAGLPQAIGRKVAVPPDDTDSGNAFEDWVKQISGWLDIPERAMTSYAKATVTLNKQQPACHMSWVTLAGVGKQTTDHGRAGGGVGADGTTAEPIGNVKLRDFFGKVVSKSAARGPMQLTGAQWKQYGGSANGTGKGDPESFDDAVLAAGKTLCADGADLADGGAWWRAVSRIDEAPLFLHRVLATATVYGTVSQDPNPPKPQPLHAVEFAISKIGLPYVWGGNGKGGGDHGGFDCSGLTTEAYTAQGIPLRRMADWQFRDTPPVPKGQDPRLGDLVFFGDPAGKIHHVGLYIGNHQMIDAPTFGQAVQVHPYTKPGDDFAGAGRVVR